MIKVKPCKCGCTDIDIEEGYEDKHGVYVCLVGCLDWECEEEVIRFSFISAENAKERAIKEWNKRMEE